MEDSKDSKVEVKTEDESPSRSEDLSKTLPAEALNHYLQGKRDMLVKDYSTAVESLGEACDLYVKHYGELAMECAEIHFLYGKALFRLSQQQAGILGDALNEGADDEDDDDDEQDDENKENEGDKSSEEMEENPEDEEEEDEDEEEDEEDDDDDEEEEEVERQEEEEKGREEKKEAGGGEESNDPSESTDSPQAVVVDESAKDSSEKEAEKNDAEQDSTLKDTTVEEEPANEPEDDMEIAWNSLETAKTIYMRLGPDNVEAQLKIADILLLLAEISMESDNNEAAIKDLEACLVIKEKHLTDDDRFLAETYYQMGLAQMLEKMYKEALGNFMTTVDILKRRKENLLKSLPVEEAPGSFLKLEITNEVSDLNSVLEDISEKIDDTKELLLNASREIQEVLMKTEKEAEKEGFSVDVDDPESISKPVSNITHLLKRKKPEQDDAQENESKRIKLPSIQNGDTTVSK